jgi:hypothetical protein
MSMLRLINTTARLIHLPNAAVNGKSMDGIKLMPGGNNVPAAYVEALFAREDRPGELFAAMIENREIVQDERPNAVALPEGPEPPKSLANYKPTAALALIDGMNRTDVLAAWAKREKRKPIRAALETKIRALGGDSAGAEISRAARAELPDADDDTNE